MDDLVVLRNLIRSTAVREPSVEPDDLFRRVAFVNLGRYPVGYQQTLVRMYHCAIN